MIRSFFLSCIFTALFVPVTAQEPPTFSKLVDFLPPAPNAAAITQYGEASVNKNTGTPNISIPLFSVKGSKLSTSVSLGYSSSGIKVDEIASRVGMGWAINAGGVINRTVRGMPDETNTRHYPYATIGFNWATYNYMKRITRSQQDWGMHGGFDSEPDLFSFSMDGYSGSFVFNGNGFAQVNKSGIRVEINTNIANDWTFKITTPDGVKYFFGGSTSKEKTRREQTCGRTYDELVVTSWYLKEIVHPNGEKIIFTYTAHTYEYESGVTQTISTGGLMQGGTPCGVANPLSTCFNIAKTYGVLLTEIESPGKSKVVFDYTTREDCEDKLISKVTLKDPSNIVGNFDLNYTYHTATGTYQNVIGMNGWNKIPYLTSLTENSSDNILHKTHHFSYNDPGGRPPRLSFSQDHWGYFNGKQNTTFTPPFEIQNTQFASVFPTANADREPEFSATQKGLLQKIVYPTGGTTHIFYEPNITGPETYGTRHKLSCEVTGTGNWNTVTKTKKFTMQFGQVVQLQIECRDNSGVGNYDSIHNKGSYMITPVGVNGTPIVITPGFNSTAPIQLFGAGEYELTFSANGAVVTTLVTLNFIPANTTSLTPESIAGGARVQKIATTSPGEQPMIKRYFYGSLADLNHSSLAPVFAPHYLGSSRRVNGEAICWVFTLNSSSSNNLTRYNNSAISYYYVTESIGDNFEGGGTEYRFNVNADNPGVVVWNNNFINAPFTNFSSFYTGKPFSETLVKKMSNGQLKPIKKTVYTYKNEPAVENSVYGYAVLAKLPDWSFTDNDTLCDPQYNPNMGSCYWNLTRRLGSHGYDMVRYDVFSSFVHPETQIDTVWDENGENPLVSVKNSFYDNFYNYQLTSATQTNSKGQVIKTTNKYPHDYMNTQVYEDMVNANNINALVNTKSEIVNTSPTPNTPLSEQQVDYGTISANQFAPVAVKTAVKGNALELDGTIDQYDAKGNILQFTSKAGIVSSIIWGYDYQYPVAQVVGATYASATAQLTVSMATLQTMDGSTLLSELNRIRTNLPEASVTTYTYKHLTGVTSITDPNNKTNSYEYDSFNRLKHIKDQDGNYVKKNEYVYATPDPNTGIAIYFNDQQSKTYTCNTCVSGYTTYPQSYVVPGGRYYSLLSVQDANNQAIVDRDTKGQDWVNKWSICSNTNCSNCDQSNCSGVDKKCVNGICETGIRVNTSSVKLKNQQAWVCTYHYKWSDNSISQDYQEVLSAPCEIWVEQ